MTASENSVLKSLIALLIEYYLTLNNSLNNPRSCNVNYFGVIYLNQLFLFGLVSTFKVL